MIKAEKVSAEQVCPQPDIVKDHPDINDYIKDNLFSNIIRRIAREWINEDIMWKFTYRKHRWGYQFGLPVYVMRAEAEPIEIDREYLVYKKLTLWNRIKRAWECFKQTETIEKR